MDFELISLSGIGQGLMKAGVVAFLLLFSLFVVAVIRQVGLMTRVFHTPLEGKLKLASWLYLGVVGFLVVVALVIL
jgi:hypothetical protein